MEKAVGDDCRGKGYRYVYKDLERYVRQIEVDDGRAGVPGYEV